MRHNKEGELVTRNRDTGKGQGSGGGAQQVLLPKDEKERAPLEQAPDFGWYLLGWIGVVFTLVGGLDLLLTWYPTAFGNPEWEFGTVSAALDGLPVLTLGLALVFGAAVAQGTRWLVTSVAIVFVVLAIVIVLAAVLYATNVPLALQSVQDPLVKTGLKKAMVKTAGQAVLYPLAFVWIAWKGWRHAWQK
jgi:hypothetical protein